jgi:hypothetical protein
MGLSQRWNAARAAIRLSREERDERQEHAEKRRRDALSPPVSKAHSRRLLKKALGGELTEIEELQELIEMVEKTKAEARKKTHKDVMFFLLLITMGIGLIVLKLYHV